MLHQQPVKSQGTCQLLINKDFERYVQMRVKMPHFGINENFPEKFGSIAVFHQQLANSI